MSRKGRKLFCVSMLCTRRHCSSSTRGDRRVERARDESMILKSARAGEQRKASAKMPPGSLRALDGRAAKSAHSQRARGERVTRAKSAYCLLHAAHAAAACSIRAATPPRPPLRRASRRLTPLATYTRRYCPPPSLAGRGRRAGA